MTTAEQILTLWRGLTAAQQREAFAAIAAEPTFPAAARAIAADVGVHGVPDLVPYEQRRRLQSGLYEAFYSGTMRADAVEIGQVVRELEWLAFHEDKARPEYVADVTQRAERLVAEYRTKTQPR
jgi:hypothetical protein